jgi:hypothetical protein
MRTLAEPLARRISTLYAHINAATLELLELIRQFDQDGCYVEFNCKSTAAWLNYACGIAPGAAREKVRVARALEGLPRIAQAFRDGRLSYSKARAITRVAEAATEPHFLNVAFHSTAAQTERIVRDWRKVAQRNRAARQAHAMRSLDWWWDDNGMLVVKGRLPAADGALLVEALQSAIPAPAAAEGSDYASVSVRRADALARVASQSLAHRGSGSTADRYQVHVHVERDRTADAPVATLEQGPVLGDTVVQRLVCDGSLVPIVADAHGEPLRVGRRRRVVHPALKRALKARDRGCRFPGCDEVRYVDAHHIRHWANGGATALENLVLLCTRHHTFLHEGGFSVERTPEYLRFRDRAGRVVPPCAEDLTVGSSVALVQNVSAETPIDPTRLVPSLDWRRPDYAHINWVLIHQTDAARSESRPDRDRVVT